MTEDNISLLQRQLRNGNGVKLLYGKYDGKFCEQEVKLMPYGRVRAKMDSVKVKL